MTENIFEWNQKRIKGIVDFYGYKFFYFKRVVDLGCGYGDLGGVLYRLGADITCVDARQEHLKVLSKKFAGIKTIKADLDGTWPFFGQRFDLILDLGLTCHLNNYKKHIQEVCASTTHLVLEMAVCDSDDSELCVAVPEDKSIYDLSINGMGCRPTTAAIEKLLRECGMNFKRMDNSKFNTDEFKYDWVPKNDKSINITKRRIWFCVKESSPIQFANPNSEIAFSPISGPPVVTATPGFIAPNQNNIPVNNTVNDKIVSTKIEAAVSIDRTDKSIERTKFAPIMIRAEEMSVNDKVRYDSREFSIITPETFIVPQNLINNEVVAAISLNSLSSKMWFKKIAPFFPKLQLSEANPSMLGFPNWPNSSPVLTMCSLSTLRPHKKIWIDEWVGLKLTNEHIEILKRCSTIVTPSLLNAQEIWKHIPEANIIRLARPWPILPVTPADGSYYLYFEKSPVLTRLLFQAWNDSFGNLVVVGGSIKVPPFAKFVSDCESYDEISRLILGAKAIIDLSDNNYYASGILKMANLLNIHIITNNIHSYNNKSIIQQDKKISLYPTSDDIRMAIHKFNLGAHSKATYNVDYQPILAGDLKKLLGV